MILKVISNLNDSTIPRGKHPSTRGDTQETSSKGWLHPVPSRPSQPCCCEQSRSCSKNTTMELFLHYPSLHRHELQFLTGKAASPLRQFAFRRGANYCVWLSQLHAGLMRDVETPRCLSKKGDLHRTLRKRGFPALPISYEPCLGGWRRPSSRQDLSVPSDRGHLVPTSAISPTVTAVSVYLNDVDTSK